MKLILASASPRRQKILKDLGVPFEVQVSQVPEELNFSLQPGKLVETLACLKAANVGKEVEEGLIIGADTIVVLGEKILGKPTTSVEAEKMLRSLSGQEHLVFSGLAVVDGKTGQQQLGHEITRVHFQQLTVPEINSYIASGEPFDKAGGYGIQGKGGLFVEKIDGCYFNVVGLPIHLLYRFLKKMGVDLLSITS